MSRSDDTFTRATTVIGDLDSPFYAEERQRDVWNEASAVGFQALLWCMLGLAAAMVWIGGQELFGWALVLILLTGFSSFLVLLQANRAGITGWEGARVRRPRVLLAIALIAVGALGVLVRSDAEVSPSGIAGGVVGFVVALGGAAGAAWWLRRQSEAEEDPDETEGPSHV